MHNNLWVNQINRAQHFGIDHIREFINLWDLTSRVHLVHEAPDSIAWKFTNDGKYSASSAYNVQFEGLTSTTHNASVWEVWAPPKCKFFAWLAMQNRIWTADRLQWRGWPNCGSYPLCNQTQDSSAHLFKCRFSIRVWKEILSWCGIQDVDPHSWITKPSMIGGPI